MAAPPQFYAAAASGQNIGAFRASDLVADVTEVLFEHSPGRGHPRYTADHTAFDVLIRCTTPQGRAAFVAIEVKFSEAPAGIASPALPGWVILYARGQSVMPKTAEWKNLQRKVEETAIAALSVAGSR